MYIGSMTKPYSPNYGRKRVRCHGTETYAHGQGLAQSFVPSFRMIEQEGNGPIDSRAMEMISWYEVDLTLKPET